MEREVADQVIYLSAEAMISALGFSVDECYDRISDLYSGLRSLDAPLLYSEPFCGGQIDDTRLQALVLEHGLQQYSRLEQLLILCIRQTIALSGVDVSKDDCGFILASTKGNMALLSAENKTGCELFLSNMARRVASYFGFCSSPIVLCNACISGVSALIVGKRLIQNGVYRHVIVAGGDELSDFIVSGFHAFKSVSPIPCKPYDANRDGLSLGEASGSLLLTCERKMIKGDTTIELLGGAITNDANHISGPSRTGEELHFAIEQALAESALLKEETSLFINAHGTATLYNDEMESKAFHLSHLTGRPLQSLKPFLGHTLGASGVVETILCKRQLEQNCLFGVPGFETIGVPYHLNVSSKHRRMDFTACLKTASGFGGCNAAIVLGKNTFSKKATGLKKTLKEPEIISRCLIGNLGVEVNGERIIEKDGGDTFSLFIRKAFQSLNLSYRKFYKMDDLSKLGFVTTAFLTRGVSEFDQVAPENKGGIMANCSASLDTDIRYRENLDKVGDQDVSPSIFVYTLPNVMLGEICIYWKMKGENTFFIQQEFNREFLLKYATMVMAECDLRYCVVGWCDLLGEDFLADFYLMKR